MSAIRAEHIREDESLVRPALSLRVDIAVIALWPGHESIETTLGDPAAGFKLNAKVFQRLAPAGQRAFLSKADDSLPAFLKTP